jgi:hypothetical protein
MKNAIGALCLLLAACDAAPVLEPDAAKDAGLPPLPDAFVGELEDFDEDGLSDDAELARGTSPTDPDTDDDGLWDGLEVQTGPDFDYVAAGCDPRKRDLLFEIDYQILDGKSSRLSAATEARLIRFYAELDIPNHDGTTGIHAVFRYDDQHILPPEFRCYYDDASGSVEGDKSEWAYPQASFRKITLCLNPPGQGGYHGNSPIASNVAKMRGPAPDLDPANDETELRQWTWYFLFLHETGHMLGLLHGGNQNLNQKVNYPSLMNESYNSGFDGSPDTLAATRIQYSPGKLPALDACGNLDEAGAFAALTPADVAFIAEADRADPFAVQGTAVDWNRDGDFGDTGVSAKLAVTDACSVKDHDDLAAIARSMRCGLPGNCAGKSPGPDELDSF